LGVSKSDATKIKEAISSFNSANKMLDEIEGLANQVITAEEPGDIPQQYIQGRIEAITKYNPQATTFLSTVDAFSSMLARAAGEKGVLTTQDVQRIINALPKLTDTKASAQLKMQTLRNLYEAIKTGAIEAYSTPISELIGGEKTLKEKVEEKGYDYDSLRKNYTDEEIKESLGIK